MVVFTWYNFTSYSIVIPMLIYSRIFQPRSTCLYVYYFCYWLNITNRIFKIKLLCYSPCNPVHLITIFDSFHSQLISDMVNVRMWIIILYIFIYNPIKFST